MKSLNQYITEFVVKKHIDNTYNYIDLDLPSGTLWATCNIGAEKPEYSGLLFQWGRIDGYKYNDKNHKFLSKDDYTTTSGTEYKKGDILKPEDDAAYQATKGKLRMPTKEECEELLKHTDNEWTELNNVKGRKFISKKDKFKWIFIPAAGYFHADKYLFYDVDVYGYVWSSSVNSSRGDTAYSVGFYSDGCGGVGLGHYRGFSVRGVCK